MPAYVITWSIDIDAVTPLEAARIAERIMRLPVRPGDRDQARVYQVLDPNRTRPVVIDLADEEAAPA